MKILDFDKMKMIVCNDYICNGRRGEVIYNIYIYIYYIYIFYIIAFKNILKILFHLHQ
jgi:hypothetical protein